MLLRHTPKEVKERNALTINPAKTCQPVGAMYAALGIHGCLPHSHGSQGCCSYHRSMLTRHYKEPVMAATSSFTEGSSVFGGQGNLIAAINNIFSIYNPEVIAIHSTCLSETIGDDLAQIIQKAGDDGKIPEGKTVLYASTPSYVGSHVTGYANMVKAMVDQLAVSTSEKKNSTINLITGWVEPSDMREIKRLAKMMGVNTIMFPDTSDVLDAPQTGTHTMYPSGGTPIYQIKASGDSKISLSLGSFAALSAAKALDRKCKVPFEDMDLPIGLAATDRFISALRTYGETEVPHSITVERGRVVDIITDMHQYLYGKRVALFGDPDHLVPLAEFLVQLDMKPVYIVSGTPGKKFPQRMETILKDIPEAKVKSGPQADMFLLHQWIKNEPVDLIIGNSYGKYIARDENIPLIRMGFPVIDRIGHSYFPFTGYNGAMRLLEKILNAFLDKKDAEAPEEKVELVM